MVEIETIDEAAEAAREAAEARRQKILESAQDRMNLVEGIPSSSTISSSHASSPDAPDAAKADDEPAAVVAAGSTASAAARMAAMRRRRFKSKQQDTTTAAATTTGAAPAKNATSKAKDSDDEKEASAPDTAVEEQEEKKQTKPEKIQKQPEEPSEPAVMVAPHPDKDSTIAADEPKKKYEGVAKMRRRMLKEKHQAQENQESGTSKTSTSGVPVVSKKLAKAKVTVKPPLMPILMHAVTVLLLFLAGLDIGLQQRSIDYYEGALLTVHTELAPRRQLGGMAVIQQWIGRGAGTTDQNNYSSRTSLKPILSDESYEDAATLHDQDEFSDVLTDNSKAGSTQSNIDPLFRVDLDKITQGPGVLLMMGRLAVRAHRFNLAIFWYGPRAFFLGLADWLLSLTTTPPILCVTAIVIRQLVGKAILGAHLPARVEDEKQHKDVMSTIKLFLSNIVLRSFPNAVRLYDVFSHVRADMYVLLCGLFVGMAISHSTGGGSAALEDLSPPLEESEPPLSTEGISDEL